MWKIRSPPVFLQMPNCRRVRLQRRSHQVLLNDIAPLLLELSGATAGIDGSMTDDFTLQELVRELAVEPGPDLRGYKLTSLERRVRKRMTGRWECRATMSIFPWRGPAAGENVNLLNTVLINVTEFFL